MALKVWRAISLVAGVSLIAGPMLTTFVRSAEPPLSLAFTMLHVIPGALAITIAVAPSLIKLNGQVWSAARLVTGLCIAAGPFLLPAAGWSQTISIDTHAVIYHFLLGGAVIIGAVIELTSTTRERPGRPAEAL